MWYYIYDAQGRLISETSVLPSSGTFAQFASRQGQGVSDWDAATRTFKAIVAEPAKIDPADIIGLLTPGEWAAIRALTDNAAVWFVDRIKSSRATIDSGAAWITDGITVLVARGVMSAARGTAFLAALKAKT